MDIKNSQELTERCVDITSMYDEKYPSGKRNYEMIEFGPVIEKRTVIIPEGKDPNKYVEETHLAIHDRLVRVVKEMVNKAIRDGRLVGVQERK